MINATCRNALDYTRKIFIFPIESFHLGNVILNVITDMVRKSKLSLEKAEHLKKRFLLFHHMLSDILSDYTEKSAISLASTCIKFAFMIMSILIFSSRRNQPGTCLQKIYGEIQPSPNLKIQGG